MLASKSRRASPSRQASGQGDGARITSPSANAQDVRPAPFAPTLVVGRLRERGDVCQSSPLPFIFPPSQALPAAADAVQPALAVRRGDSGRTRIRTRRYWTVR